MTQFLVSKYGLILIGFLAVTAYFLLTEHLAHVVTALPWLLVGGCLFMHFLMHRSHGGRRGKGNKAKLVASRPPQASLDRGPGDES